VQTPQIAPDAVRILLIGGVDPGGGAGLVRDVLTATARGARPTAVGTAWADQGPHHHRVEARAPEFLADAVRQQVAAGPGAVKVGMIPDVPGAEAIITGLAGYEGPVVVDPVLASSRGRELFRGAPADLLALCGRATLVTPNAAEAAALTGRRVADLEDAAAAARALGALGCGAVLVKGGHLGGPDEPATDTLLEGGRLHRFAHPRVAGGDVRGTGCALATAIAVELARGRRIVDAVEVATAWLARAIAAAVDVSAERHLGWPPPGGD
jgi:hydroxymethylpyrimidine/phosphomethylpyrimidine kinase